MVGPLRIGLLGAAFLLVVGIAPALTASNPVPPTHLGRTSTAVNANTLKPTTCAAIALSTVSSVTGDGNANLVLGTAAAQTVRGNAANDCLVAGGGNDTLNGGAGTDVCIGGPGTDTFNANCETQIQ